MMYIFIMIKCTFFDKMLLFSKWYISATITSWKDIHTTTPTYFFIGKPFPIDLRVFEHSIGRLHDHNVSRVDRRLAVIQWKSMNCNGNLWKINENQGKSTVFFKNSPLRSGSVMTFSQSNRWIEVPNTRKSTENGFTMEKYIGTVVRKSLQLVMVAEIHYFENINIYQKKYTFYIHH